jgi:hypothetical protein
MLVFEPFLLSLQVQLFLTVSIVRCDKPVMKRGVVIKKGHLPSAVHSEAKSFAMGPMKS